MRVLEHYYVLPWFHAEVYHILELSPTQQVGAVQTELLPDWSRHQTMDSRRKLSGLLLLFLCLTFLCSSLERIPASVPA